MSATTENKGIKIPTFNHFTQTVHHEPYDKISPLRPELSAHGKNIVVTGGGTGIGKAIALEFARAGAKSVSILGRRPDRLQTATADITAARTDSSTFVLYRQADLQQLDQVEAALRSISGEVGKLHVLVSNAAMLQTVAPLAGYEAAEFMRGFDGNVRTAFNAVQAFLPLAVDDEPTIINISSGIAHVAPVIGLGGYAAGKAAALKMMDYFAAENPHLHVVNVQPGAVKTEMTSKVQGAPGTDAAELPGQFSVWLCSPEARFLKGRYVWANWDVEELAARADEIRASRLLTWLLDGAPM